MAKGLLLRTIIVLALLDANRPMTLVELARAVADRGFAIDGRASKTMADALRHERRRGRVVWLRRGTYAAGYVAKSTQHRFRMRVVAATRNQPSTATLTARIRPPR